VFFKKLGIITLIFILSGSKLLAMLSIDAAAFRDEAGQASVEIYYTIPRKNLNWQESNGQFQAEIPIITKIAFRGQIIFADTSRLLDKCKDPQLIESAQAMPHQMNLSIPPGIYTINAHLANTKISASTEIVVPNFNDNELRLSDIQCISDLAEPSPGSIFNKYGQYAVIPYPSRLYSLEYPVLNILFEIYNMSFDARSPGNYKIETRILDMNENLIMNLGSESYTVPRQNFPVIHSYDISGLKGGTANLEILVTDFSSEKIASSRKKIYMLNPEESAAFLVDDDPTAKTEKELDSLYYILQPIMSNTEKRLYKNSNYEGKINFFHSFWAMRDPKPETPHNEYQLEVNRRIQYANEHFVSHYRSGASTDKGIILLKYGFPDDVQVFRSTSDTKPYEIWNYYELEGGVQFYFGDISGFNQYELIHSTKHDEYQDPNWQKKLNY
jgi:GWxTD domain-containing protein